MADEDVLGPNGDGVLASNNPYSGQGTAIPGSNNKPYRLNSQ